jgi:homoprotocatechuate degradation regulator HpaR
MSDNLQRAPAVEAREFRDSLPLALLRAREAVMTLFRPNLQAHKLTEQQWRLIRVLYENGELEFNRLAELACILRPSLTGILSRLEQAGLVLRQKNLPDQRKLCIDLTDEGRRLFESLMPEVNRIYREEIEQRFPPEELQQLFQLLDKLRHIAEGAPAANGSHPQR